MHQIGRRIVVVQCLHQQIAYLRMPLNYGESREDHGLAVARWDDLQQ